VPAARPGTRPVQRPGGRPEGDVSRLSAGLPEAWIYLAKLNYAITSSSPPMYRLAVSLDLWGLQRGDKPVRAAR